jgi:hypothetical protein
MDQIFVIDWSQVLPEVIAGLNNGSMHLSASNGLAYWARGSGHSGVAQQLPFVAAQIPDGSSLLESVQLLQHAQHLSAALTALSTGVMLGAIVLQTKYLASKLNQLQATIDTVSLDVHCQNIVSYMSKITDFFGAIETARIYMLDRELKHEVKDLAIPLLSDLATRRNQLFAFIDNILKLIEQAPVSARYYEIIIDFVTTAMALIPKAVYVEKELYAFVDKFGVADLIADQAAQRYQGCISDYRTWCNGQHKSAIKGNKLADTISGKKADLTALFTADENKLLLPRV